MTCVANHENDSTFLLTNKKASCPKEKACLARAMMQKTPENANTFFNDHSHAPQRYPTEKTPKTHKRNCIAT